MALKAGRVGVAPDQVDEFGKINSEATEGYTKQEADAKFETQTHAASTYETKSDAAALQPIQLSVPVELLSGSALTVENGLHGMADDRDRIIDRAFSVDPGAGFNFNTIEVCMAWVNGWAANTNAPESFTGGHGVLFTIPLNAKTSLSNDSIYTDNVLQMLVTTTKVYSRTYTYSTQSWGSWS